MANQIKKAKSMLANEYTINGRTATGYEFMFGQSVLGAMGLDDVDEALDVLVKALQGSPWQMTWRG